jgi:hypothetical protein
MTMDPELLDKLEKLQVLTLQPGDILVATLSARLPAERLVHSKDQLKRFVPDHEVMVVSSDVELAALRTEPPRPAPADQSWLQLETS